MLQLCHINLHFDFKNSLQCIYLIINVIFTLLENIFMNFKVFLLIFDISIFIKKYPPIYLRYIRYIHKMQVPIYPSKPIFSTLDIGKRESVFDLITNAQKITNFIDNYGWLVTIMRKICGGDIVRLGETRFATNYIALASLLKKRVDLKKIFIINEWASHKLSRTTVRREVEGLMFNHLYWEKISNLVSIYEVLYIVLCIVDSEIVITMSFVYELIRIMKQNLHTLKAKDWVKKIIVDHWDKTLKHPLHTAGNYSIS